MGLDVTIDLFDLAGYRMRVAPILDSFFREPAPALLAGAIRNLSSDSLGCDGSQDEIEDCLRVLEGRQRYSPSTNHDSKITLPEEMTSFVRFQVAPLLVSTYCVLISQNVSRSRLPLFLYEHSSWLEEYLCFSRSPSGGLLEYASGECTEIFDQQEVVEFWLELEKLPAPLPDLKPGFDNLRHIVASVDADRGVVLVRSVC